MLQTKEKANEVKKKADSTFKDRVTRIASHLYTNVTTLLLTMQVLL